MYGYKDNGIPSSLDHFNPLILHESSVIRYIDDKGNFRYLGNGTFGNVYLGEMKGSGKPAVMKQFTEETLLDGIDREARILMYLEDTGVFPKFYGYIPCGGHVNNISMVMEYLPNSETLSATTDHDAITIYQWLLVVEQMTRALKVMHSKFILHNDLHTDNILIMWNDTNPVVRLIDTGFATFRYGQFHGISPKKLNQYPIYPPEAVSEETNPSMDIYAMGFSIKEINRHLGNDDIKSLAEYCHQRIPEYRPTTDQILYRLEQLKKKYSNESGIGYKKLMHGELLSSEKYQQYVTAPLPMIMIDELSPPPDNDAEEWLILYTDYSSYVGTYKHKDVIIRLFHGREYDKVRNEIALAKFASSIGIAPHFYGITFHGTNMTSAGFVQEYVRDSMTLLEAFKAERSKWVDKYRLNIACKLIKSISMFHDQHILINNIKSSTILYSENGTEPVILLEGFHRCSDSSGLYNTEDSIYSAPETKKDNPTTFASDVYSLGVVLQLLFHNSNLTDVTETINTCLQSNAELRPTVQQLYLTMCGGDIMKSSCHDEL
ncbi:hypothetical protein SNE40_000661 [Patella caerulea]|uniref:Protein kinase domain-containing protein n=1 Tax=Patella caerulea TaxID=87958 RepID=A0AAN8KCP5_PATCE